MPTDKRDNNSSLSSVNEEMTRHMADIFEKRNDPDFKAKQRVIKTREENINRTNENF